jgi:hypothetical protein
MGPNPGPGLRQPGRVTLGGQSQKPAHGTGFRRFDLRDEFSGLRRRGTERREAFGGLGPEKGTFSGAVEVPLLAARSLVRVPSGEELRPAQLLSGQGIMS